MLIESTDDPVAAGEFTGEFYNHFDVPRVTVMEIMAPSRWGIIVDGDPQC
jgi:hypothetical protein